MLIFFYFRITQAWYFVNFISHGNHITHESFCAAFLKHCEEKYKPSFRKKYNNFNILIFQYNIMQIMLFFLEPYR